MAKICALLLNEHTIDNHTIKVSKALDNFFNIGAINKCKIKYTFSLDKDQSNKYFNLKIIYNGRIQYIENSLFGHVENYWHFYDEVITLTNVAPIYKYYNLKPKITFHNIDIINMRVINLNQLEVTFDYTVTLDNILKQDIIDVTLVQDKK